ncbi:MAG: hypothetical protein WC006_09065 [Bacilli bacterium]
MSLYDYYLKLKQDGNEISFDNLPIEELKTMFLDENISDKNIAILFNTSKDKVSYRRRKHNITIFEKLMGDKNITKMFKDVFLENINYSDLAKASTVFAFRNGPVENMHAKNQLSQSDMKILNKFMVNRLAYIFKLLLQEEWVYLMNLVEDYLIFASDWDEPEIDDGFNKDILKMKYKKIKDSL